MGKLSSIETVIANDTTALYSSTKVCMHVLGAARNDPRVMREATALVEEGFAVSIVDVEGDCDQPIEEEIRGVYMKHIIMPASFIAARFTRRALFRATQIVIRSTLRLIQTPADIYHAHDESGLPACFLAALLRRKLLIFDAHELPLNDISSALFTRMKPLLTHLLAYALSYCAGVITVSPPIAQEIHKYYHVPTVSLVRNALAHQVPLKSDRLRQKLGLSSEVRIALYQGSWRQNRGLDMLVRAARFLEQDIVIVIMGEGETKAQLEALITSEAVADRVKILPPVPYAELLDWTASADIGLIVYSPDYSLNVRMCLPNKLFEYLMAGLPILASRLDAVSEVIRTYDVGQIVPSFAPEDISAAINAIFADPVAFARIRRNALEVSQHELCWEKEKNHLIHLYHDILKTRSTKRAT